MHSAFLRFEVFIHPLQWWCRLPALLHQQKLNFFFLLFYDNPTHLPLLLPLLEQKQQNIYKNVK